MYDETLKLYEGTLTSDTDGDAKALGRNRSFTAILRVGGDVTGTSPTLDVTIQQSATGTGSWTTIGTFTQVTDEMVGYIATATPRYEVPGEDPLTCAFNTTQDYVRAVLNIGGTASPTFPLTSIHVVPNDTAHKRSGVA